MNRLSLAIPALIYDRLKEEAPDIFAKWSSYAKLIRDEAIVEIEETESWQI